MADRLRLEVILEAIDKATGPLRRIMGGAAGAAEAVRKSKAALKGLQAESANIKDFANLRAGLRKTTAALDDYTNRAGASRVILEAQRNAHHQLTGEVKVARLAFKQAGQAMRANGSQSAEAAAAYLKQQQALAALEAKLNASKAALNKQTGATRGAEAAVKRLTNDQAKLNDKLNAVRSKLEAAGLSTDKLAKRQAQLRTQVRKATLAIEQQEKRTQALARTQAMAARMKSAGMDRFTQGTSMALTGFGVTRAAAFPIAAAVEFESSMADVRKVVNGLNTPVAFRQMGRDIQDLSTRVPMVSNEIARLVAFGGQALGQDTAHADLLRFAEDAAKMGVAFDMAAEDAGQTMATWRTAFRLGQDGAVQLADQVNYLGNTGPANAAKITAIINRIGALGEVAGLQSAPLSALGATIGGMGIEDEVAATGIKNLLLRLNAGTAATKRQKVAFRALGLDAGRVARGMQMDARGTILDVLERIRNLPHDLQTSTLTQMFGTESVAAIAPLLTNLDLLRENLDKVSNAERYGGSMEAEYASRKATTANTITLLKNSATVLAQRLGELLLPQVTALATRATELMSKLSAWAKENPRLAATLAKVAIVGGILLTVLGVGLAIFGGLSMAIGHIVTLAGTLSGVLSGAGIAAGSIAAPLLVIAAVGLLIWKYWDQVKALLSGMWDGFLEGLRPVQPALDMLRDMLQQLLAPTSASKEALEGFAKVGKFIGWLFGTQLMVAITAVALVVKGLGTVFQAVGTFIGVAAAAAVTAIGAVIDIIKGVFTLDGAAIMAGFQALWLNVNQFFGGLPAKFMTFGINMVQGLANGITSMLGAPGKALANVANGAIARLKNLLGIHSPSRVFAALGGHTMAGFTQGLLGGESGAQAALGRIGAGLRRTGAGLALGAASAAVAASPANIDHRPPLAFGAGGGGNGATYNITINAPAGAPAQDIATLVRQEIERLEHQRRARTRAELSDYD